MDQPRLKIRGDFRSDFPLDFRLSQGYFLKIRVPAIKLHTFWRKMGMRSPEGFPNIISIV